MLCTFEYYQLYVKTTCKKLTYCILKICNINTTLVYIQYMIYKTGFHYVQEYNDNLETEYRLFPPVTKFLDLFPRAGYFFNASD